MKSTIFWDIRSCSPMSVNRRFGGTYRLHLQDRRISRARNQFASRALLAPCFHAGFLLGLLFDPEDGVDMFFRNICSVSTDYTALPRRWHSSSKTVNLKTEKETTILTLILEMCCEEVKLCLCLGLCYCNVSSNKNFSVERQLGRKHLIACNPPYRLPFDVHSGEVAALARRCQSVRKLQSSGPS
jgi:hypothetical protein